MKQNLFIAIAALLFVLSCTDKTISTECVVQRTDLALSHELFTHLVSDDSRHYLFGAVEEDIRDYQTKKITIEQAKVGKEGAWTLLSTHLPGVGRAVDQTTNYIFVVSQQYLRGQDPKFSKLVLYRIAKRNGNPEKLYEWYNENSFIRSVFFESDSVGFAFMRPSGDPLDYQFMSTSDGGRSWKVLELNRAVGKTQHSEAKLYFLLHKGNKSDWIYSIDKEQGTLDSLHFDLDITDFSVEDNEDYWLLGKDGTQTVLQHYRTGETTTVYSFSGDAEFFPEQLYKYNDLVAVLTGKIDKSILGGFGGTKHKMYLSNDEGMNWAEHKMNEALYINPVSIYKDKQITAYIGKGKIMSCTP